MSITEDFSNKDQSANIISRSLLLYQLSKDWKKNGTSINLHFEIKRREKKVAEWPSPSIN